MDIYFIVTFWQSSTSSLRSLLQFRYLFPHLLLTYKKKVLFIEVAILWIFISWQLSINDLLQVWYYDSGLWLSDLQITYFLFLEQPIAIFFFFYGGYIYLFHCNFRSSVHFKSEIPTLIQILFPTFFNNLQRRNLVYLSSFKGDIYFLVTFWQASTLS